MQHDLAPHTFVAESRELLREMESALLTLEQAPRDTEAVNAVFRAMHTIKGSSGVFGFDVIVEFAHVMEGVVDEVRAGRVAVDEDLVALLLTSGDHVSALIDCLEAEDRSERLEAARAGGAELLHQLGCYCAPAGQPESPLPANGRGAPTAAQDTKGALTAATSCWHVSVRFSPDVLHHGMDPLSFLRYLSTLGEIVGMAALFDAMPPADAMDPEACYMGLELQFSGPVDRQSIEDAFEYVRDDSSIRILSPHAPLADYMALIRELPEDAQTLGRCLVDCGALLPGELEQAFLITQALPLSPAVDGLNPGMWEVTQDSVRGRALSVPAPDTARRAAENRYVRVHADKLDELITLVGELVIAGAGVSLCARRSADSDLREATANMARLVEEVRDGALSLRMVPIGETFHRFNRVVRDLSRELGKEVDLVITGAETELDKSMVEKLNDPLMHLVRNALDHGIEAPKRRLACGKPTRGKLMLNAYHETGNIVVEIADDGAGLDRERILERARDKGMVQDGQALSEQDIFDLVMEPGFSTAATLTSLSGRGVGMDVVRRNVEALRGSITISSEAQQGTLIALRVPLTLAIIDGFLVGVGSSTYVIPLEMVVECFELPVEDRSRVRESGYVNLRGQVLPLLRLRELFDVPGAPGKRENVVVVNYGGQQAGFLVDALLGEFQTVIKPLGRLFERLAGISGSTILGTGEVALILDVPGLVQKVLVADIARQPRLNESTATQERLTASPLGRMDDASVR